MKNFDIAVIGSGPGGYVAAIRCAQLGYKTVLIEKYNVLGGTCTNVGCIPTKALLDSSHLFHEAQVKFEKHGIQINQLSLNFEQMFKRKQDVISKNTDGLNYLMKKNNITVLTGTAQFINEHQIKIVDNNTEQILKASNFIIATGSKPASLPGIEIDKKRIITSTEALSLKELPKSMAIVGGGVIGVEMASIFKRLGTKITILEYADRLIANMDSDLGKTLQKVLKKEGVEVLTEQSVYKIENLGNSAKVYYKNNNKEEQQIEAEFVLMAVGRKAYTENLGLENTGVTLDIKGFIEINEKRQTNVPHIYAIGDVVGGAMLAHKAEEEGVFVAEIINGQKPHINPNNIPGVVYTWPEVASVGATEQQLKKDHINYNIGKFPFSASARSRASMDTEGFVKVLVEPKYGEVLGVHIIGPRSADLIAQAVVALEYEVTAKDMFRISYAHPTYSEVLKEAYMLAYGQAAINI